VKLDVEALIAPLIALVLLVLIVQQTMGALRGAGAWGPRHVATAHGDDPYGRLDRILASRDSSTANLRDPFEFGRSPQTQVVVHHTPVKVAPPVSQGPPPPVLTSIIFDNDPRATIRYNDRDYPVRVNSLFGDYRVVSIARDQVVIDRSGETLVLRLHSKGE
jgi:hypothetical protein